MNLLPSVSYDAINNSFNIGFSLTGLSNYYQQRHRNRIQLTQLKEKLNERLELKTNNLELEIEKFKNEYKKLKNKSLVFEISVKLFEITKGKYRNNEISTKDFLALKKAFLTELNDLKNSLYNLRLKAKKIEVKTKNEVYTTSLNSLTNLIDSYETN